MNWSVEEEKKLYSAVLKFGENKVWERVPDLFPNRTIDACQLQWQDIKKRGIIRGNWSIEEDDIILEAAREGVVKWSDVVGRLYNLRTGKQCRERWSNHLNPILKKLPWTDEEDQIIIKSQAVLGNSWTKIARLLRGRSENEVKNRWYAVIIKRDKPLKDSDSTIGVKRKLENEKSEEDAVVENNLSNDLLSESRNPFNYSEEDCDAFIKETNHILRHFSNYHTYSQFEKTFEEMGPFISAFQDIADHYLFSMLHNLEETGQRMPSNVTVVSSAQRDESPLKRDSAEIELTTSSTNSIDESIDSNVFHHISQDSSTSSYHSANLDAIQSLLRLHVSGTATPTSVYLGQMSQSTSPLWMEYGFTSPPASPKDH